MSVVFQAAGGSFGLLLRHKIFWLLTRCSLNACFLYPGYPLYDATCDPLQLGHFVVVFFWGGGGGFASLFGHPL